MTAPTVGSTAANVSTAEQAAPQRWPVKVRRDVLAMQAEWDLVDDLEMGTPRIREKRDSYLPKFPAEHRDDYKARVEMTFVENHYLRALDELVGLAFTKDPALDDDVPEPLVELMENVTGEGEHLDLFAQRALWTALHYGHAAILTDMPTTTREDGRRLTERDVRDRAVRPYARIVAAKDILDWDVTSFGGVEVLTRVAFVEDYDQRGAAHKQVREFEQAVLYDDVTGAAIALGAIEYVVWREEEQANKRREWMAKDRGTLEGPSRIPFRVFYGSKKFSPLVTRPACADLAYTNIELAQVASDRANVMHKCNVPTPWFVGLRLKKGEKLNLTEAILLEDGGTAGVLEPTGVALGATAARMDELRGDMRRQGAALPDGAQRTMTATEATLYARQRNARLQQSVRSLQDALEGMLADFAAFLNLPESGSVTLSREFSAHSFDVPYLTLLKDIAREGLLPLDAFYYALQHGKLPDDFDAMDAALKAMAEMEATQKAEEEQRKRDAEMLKQQGAPPNGQQGAPPNAQQKPATIPS